MSVVYMMKISSSRGNTFTGILIPAAGGGGKIDHPFSGAEGVVGRGREIIPSHEASWLQPHVEPP